MAATKTKKPAKQPDLLADNFEPKKLPLYKQTAARIEAAMAVAKAFTRSKSTDKEGKLRSAEARDKAAEVLILVQDVDKEIEANRKASTKPLRDRKDLIDGAFNEMRGPVKGAREALKAAIGVFNKEERDRVAEAQAVLDQKAAEDQEAEDKAAKEEGREPVEIQAPDVTPAGATRTSTGTVAGTKVRKYCVTDFSKLSDEFKEENKGALNRAAKSGRESEPGVEFYYDEDGVAVTKRS